VQELEVRDAITYQLEGAAQELDRNSRKSRIASVLGVAFFVGVAVVTILAFLPRVRAGTLDSVGWAAIMIVLGFTLAIVAQSRYLLWQARRAATRLTIRADRVELAYPEGRTVRFLWSDPKARFMLYDGTEAPSYRKVVSTAYFLGDRQRLSAIPREAYDRILEEARRNGVVRSKSPERSILAPSLYMPVNWEISGRRSATAAPVTGAKATTPPPATR
jgi:hypothetical protein